MKISDTHLGATGDTRPADDKPKDTDDVQKQLEQQQIDDQQRIDDLIRAAESTDVKKDTDAGGAGKHADVSFKGSSCGGGHGCSGSTWCYGSGDFR